MSQTGSIGPIKGAAIQQGSLQDFLGDCHDDVIIYGAQSALRDKVVSEIMERHEVAICDREEQVVAEAKKRATAHIVVVMAYGGIYNATAQATATNNTILRSDRALRRLAVDTNGTKISIFVIEERDIKQ